MSRLLRFRPLFAALERAPAGAGLPTWAWVAGGVALATGAGTAAYFAFRSPESESQDLPSGSMAHVQLPLR